MIIRTRKRLKQLENQVDELRQELHAYKRNEAERRMKNPHFTKYQKVEYQQRPTSVWHAIMPPYNVVLLDDLEYGWKVYDGHSTRVAYNSELSEIKESEVKKQ